jgi:molybdenum cofactor cytidylyltransferase
MGSSLKAGLEYLGSKDSLPDVVIISVCDQPLLSAKNISNLLKKYQETGKPIVASRYSGKPGVPALFDRSCFSKLQALGDGQGAKSLMLQNPDDVTEVEFPGGEVDLDTMEDYEKFVNRQS